MKKNSTEVVCVDQSGSYYEALHRSSSYSAVLAAAAYCLLAR